MSRLGRFPHAQPIPTTFARGLIFVAVILLHGPASALEIPGPGTGEPADQAAEDEKTREILQQFEWTDGPATIELGTVARLKLARGLMFTGPDGGRRFLESRQSLAPKDLLGIVAPVGSFEWFVVFEEKPPHRGPDAKGRPDADALLATLRRENEEDNATRRTREWPECANLDWERPPSYERDGENLTWATRFDVLGQRGVNYTARVFGPRGAIDAHLVAAPKELDRLVPALGNLLTLVKFRESPPEGGTGDASSASGGAGSGDRSSATIGRSLVKSGRLIGGIVTGLGALVFGAYKKFRS